jgi:hypothetical protein
MIMSIEHQADRYQTEAVERSQGSSRSTCVKRSYWKSRKGKPWKVATEKV